MPLATACVLAGEVLLSIADARGRLTARVPCGIWIALKVLGIVAAAIAGISLWRGRSDAEQLRTAVIVALIGAAVMALISRLVRHLPQHWLWLQVLVLLIAACLAFVLAAWDWTLRHTGVLAVVLVLLLGGTVLRIGERQQRADLFAPVAAAITERDALAQTANTNTSAAVDSATKAVGETHADLQAAIAKVDSVAEADAGREVLSALTAGDLALAMTKLAALDLVAVSVTDPDSAPMREAARGAYGAAIAAQPDKLPAVPSTAGVDDAIGEACNAAKASGAAAPACSDRPSDVPKAPEARRALHDLQVQLATYRVAVDGSDANKAQLEAAIAAAEPKLDRSLVGMFAAAPGAIADSVDPTSSFGILPGPLGWAILGLVLLLLLRFAMRLNAAQLAGPVQIDPADGKGQADLRLAILSNLKTPAATPGAGLTQSITDIVAVTPSIGQVAKVVAAVGNALAPVPGFTVTAEATTAKAPTDADGSGADTDAKDASDKMDGPTTVLARVSTTATKAEIANNHFSGEDSATAMRTAGLWVAGLLLDRSTRIPSWATWNQDTAQALSATNAKDPSLDSLATALTTAPTSGLVLQLYGNALELHDRRLDAISIYARAVVVHPHYLIARYRLAVALGMASRDQSAWNALGASTQAALTASIRRALDRLDIDEADSLAAPMTTEKLASLARALLESMLADLHVWNRLATFMRRSERERTWPVGRANFRTWRRAFNLAKSGWLAYPAAEPTTWHKVKGWWRKKMVARHASKSTSSWQISYNLACQAASFGDPHRALDLLECCLLRPGIHELRAEWVHQDADLAPIRTYRRFGSFCEQLDQRTST